MLHIHGENVCFRAISGVETQSQFMPLLHTYTHFRASWLILDISVLKQRASALSALIFSLSPESGREREAMRKGRMLQRKWPDLQPIFCSMSVLCFFLSFFLNLKFILPFINGTCSLLCNSRVFPIIHVDVTRAGQMSRNVHGLITSYGQKVKNV